MEETIDISRLDLSVREGRHKEVCSEIERLRKTDFPRSQAADLANIARRAGAPELCLKILHPFVRPEIKSSPATAKEQAIYAAALARIGALTEALQILVPLKDTKVPEVLLYLAFTYIHQWDYENSAKVLRLYLQDKSISQYERTIGQLNLLAAYRFLDHSPNEQVILAEAIEVSRGNKWALLERNALHVATQAAISRQDWSRADDFLTQAEQVAKDNELDHFLLRKWRALLNLHRHGPTSESLESLSQIRKEAQSKNDFETMRDSDFYRALFLQDRDLFLNVYFGTPYALYRKRMEERARSWLEIPNSYVLQMQPTKSDRVFDLSFGKERSQPEALKSGSVLLSLLQILASDSYRPFQMISLFNSIYPNEIFDPYHSADRVKAVLKRLRKWLVEQNLPLQIENRGRDYFLTSFEPYALLINTSSPQRDELPETSLALLKEHWPYRSFSTSQAAEFLGIDREQALAILKEAVKRKKLRRTGGSRNTVFCFSK